MGSKVARSKNKVAREASHEDFSAVPQSDMLETRTG
jgi:hypothetical protein